MEWKEWIGKKVFIQLRSGGVYTATVIEVDDSSKPFIWIAFIDKFGKNLTIAHSEIIKIVEENR